LVPRDKSSSSARDSSASCSSKSDVSTIAEAPASSIWRTLSIVSDKGVEATTMGLLSFMPRYCIEMSIIFHLRRWFPPACLQALLLSLQAVRCAAFLRGRACRRERSKRAIGAQRRLAPPSAARRPPRDCCAQASYIWLRDRHIP